MHLAARNLLALSLVSAFGCHQTPAPRVAVNPPPVISSTKTYTDPTSQVSFDYPAGWSPGHGNTAVFQATSPDHTVTLSLDVPNLPFHLPGMITAGAVANGYISDRKKRLTDATVEQNQPLTIPDASARRVKITGTEGNSATTDFAVLIVHADKVFILSSDTTGPDPAPAANALDAAVASLRWGK